MLTFNTGDIGLRDLMAPLKQVYDERQMLSYWVYGLRETLERPHIAIKIHDMSGNAPRFEEIKEFFSELGLVVVNQGGTSRIRSGGVAIGLRRDIRRDAGFAQAIVRTVIHWSEGRLRGGLATVNVPLPECIQTSDPTHQPARCSNCNQESCANSLDNTQDCSRCTECGEALGSGNCSNC